MYTIVGFVLNICIGLIDVETLNALGNVGLLVYIHAYLCYDCYSMIAFSSVQNALCKEHNI